MMLGLVFSKDRALQLDACLTSFFKRVLSANAVTMTVLYGASSERHRRQYKELAGEQQGRVRFVPEADFRRDVLEVLGVVGRGRPAGITRGGFRSWWRPAPRGLSACALARDWVLFLVDDTLFVDELRIESVESTLQESTTTLGFSLRLGTNTTYCYVLDRQQNLPEFQTADGGFLRYKWPQADGDFAYPLELSSSVYRLPMIQQILHRLSFSDPNTLESQLSLQARRFARTHPWMVCPARSVAFSAPLNRVQRVFENRAGADPGWSTESLADKFDQGLRVNTAALDGFIPTACHQEVELAFEPRPSQPAT